MKTAEKPKYTEAQLKAIYANAVELFECTMAARAGATATIRECERHMAAAGDPNTGMGARWDECAANCYAHTAFVSKIHNVMEKIETESNE